MSDGTTPGRGGELDRADGRDRKRTGEALDEILSNEAKFRYLVLALVATGLWWRALDPISAFAAGMGFLVLVFVAEPVLGMLAATRWTTAEGVVLESEVLTRRQAMERAGADVSGDRSVAGYVPLVRYRYDVDGTTYENARVSPIDASTSRRRWAERVIDSYPENAWVDVRHHPDDPTRSYLQSWTIASRVNVFAPIALFLLTLAVIVAIGVNTDSGVPAGLVPIVFGLPFALWGLYGIGRAIRSARWPTTTGAVTGTNVKSVTSGESGSNSYRMEVIYEYELGGETYVSKRYSFGGKPTRESRSAAETWLEEHYPVGSEVTVHYDPDRPDVTVLERGGVLSAFVGFLAGLAFCGLGVYILLGPGLGVPPVVERWITRLLERV